jgi:hypothetical protein
MEIAIGVVGGFVLGSIYGKYVLAGVSSIKKHITDEIAALETRIKAKI